MDHVPMKIHQASTVDHQHQWCFHQKHMTANVVNPKHVTNESRVICTPPRSPRLIWRKNSWMALNDAMPKIKTWYWSMESGFAWNPPLLRGPRRYGNGAAMKTIRKNQNLSETHRMFSGTCTDAGNLQLEPCHCELQPNTPTGWQFMRHTKMILPRSPPATLSPQSKELPGRCSTFPDPMAVDLEAESCQRGMTTKQRCQRPFYQRLLEKTFYV